MTRFLKDFDFSSFFFLKKRIHKCLYLYFIEGKIFQAWPNDNCRKNLPKNERSTYKVCSNYGKLTENKKFCGCFYHSPLYTLLCIYISLSIFCLCISPIKFLSFPHRNNSPLKVPANNILGMLHPVWLELVSGAVYHTAPYLVGN